jgi:uncharacterized protein YggU (UPF0235/DUF167 family)
LTALPYRLTASGVTLSLRVTPNAVTDRFEGVEQRDDGSAVLRLRVAAVADRGRANAAVMALIAKSVGVPKSAVRLLAGETARLKLVAIDGDGPALAARLAALLG